MCESKLLINKTNNSNEVYLSIVMASYNQEEYVGKAIESIINQQFTFEWELIIGDDCSSDNTLYIEKKYANINSHIEIIENSKNLGVVNNRYNLYGRCRGKYIMVCDGDDWWEKNKVYEQISFMEAHNDCDVLFSNVYLYESGQISKRDGISEQDINIENMLIDNMLCGPTFCMKREIMNQYLDFYNRENLNFKIDDYPLWLYILVKGYKISFINKYLCYYRIVENSISHKTNIKEIEIFNKAVEEIKKYFVTKYITKNYNCYMFDIYHKFLTKKYSPSIMNELKDKFKFLEKYSIKYIGIYLLSLLGIIRFIPKLKEYKVK